MLSRLQSSVGSLSNVGKYGLVLVTVVFISLLFPEQVRFRYQYKVDGMWPYEDLYAPFDFAIKKSEAEIQEEEASLLSDLAPFYTFDSQVARRQKMAFEKAFQDQLQLASGNDQFKDVERNTEKYLKYGRSMLDRLFERGILGLDESHKEKGPDFVINVVRGNTVQRKTLQSLMGAEEARELITDSLPYSKLYVAEFLLPILPESVEPNLLFSDSLTNLYRVEQLQGLVTSKGMINEGDLIISRGSRITPDVYEVLRSYEEAYLERTGGRGVYWQVFFGFFLLTGLILGVFAVYLQYYAPEVFNRFKPLVFVLMWLVVYSYLVFAVESTESLSSYIIPFCIVPIVVKIFYSDRLAFFTHIVVILVASFLSSLGYEFTVVQILAGIVAVMSNPDARDWSKFFRSMLYIFLTYSLAYVGLVFMQEGQLEWDDSSYFIWIFLNVFLTLLAFPLVPLLERLFGFTSSISLVELSDMNRPLLRDLALKAPGTLQHSLQVANLSEAAARLIDADALLVRVAALYHDIGKMNNPEYFIENQSGENPHNKLEELESARIIIDHVIDGEALAKKHRLPKILIDFIRTHHGTTRTEYFYRTYIQKHPDKESDEPKFRYPGPKPKTKEETILMLADSLEASSKSLRSPTGQDIDELVEKIIAGKITRGQLHESEMTFEELEISKTVFKKLLRSINHVRVEYPDEKEG
ncbi:MAG: HDIG domain-containing protein [Bacteroidetes bacterium]|nr:HDIG domain-containing protein [Bacteroidota bacterium]